MSSKIAAVSVWGYNFQVYYDHQPKEEATNEYPGCPEDLEITAVYLNGQDILPLMNKYALVEIKTKILGGDFD